jgi:hypothetical protein
MPVSDKRLYGWTVLDYNGRWPNIAERTQRSIELCRCGCLMPVELVIVLSTRTPQR